MYQFSGIKVFSTNQSGNLLLLDDPGRVRSQIISVMCRCLQLKFTDVKSLRAGRRFAKLTLVPSFAIHVSGLLRVVLQ
jgi:hypothetical protein